MEYYIEHTCKTCNLKVERVGDDLLHYGIYDCKVCGELAKDEVETVEYRKDE